MKTIVSFLVLILLSGLNSAESNATQEEAVSVAQKWLELVESGQLNEGWKTLSSQYKINVTQQKWQTVCNSVYNKPTKAIDRKIIHISQWHDRNSDNDESSYVTIRFKTTYDDKTERVQMITPRLEQDGQWRVAGFYFR